MSDSNFSANADSFDGAMVTVAAGFEAAVADYEYSWMAFQSSKSGLNDAHHAFDVTSARLEEATISLDEIATEFNAARVHDEDYAELMDLLDITRDHMIEASEDHDTATANLIHADKQYEAHKANIDEALAIARELRTEFDYTAQMDSSVNAANDDQFDAAEAADYLSESAKHFYHHAA